MERRLTVAYKQKKTSASIVAKALRKKRRRKRKLKSGSRYETGLHESKKCTNGPAKFRSGWELVVCQYLDITEDVLEYQYEPFKIQYVSNQRTGRLRTYIPDFYIVFKDGSKKLVEVKSKRHVDRPTVKKKAIIARAWAERNGMLYEFWMDDEIKEFKKIIKAHNKNVKK